MKNFIQGLKLYLQNLIYGAKDILKLENMYG